jgi:hypothetical protein
MACASEVVERQGSDAEWILHGFQSMVDAQRAPTTPGHHRAGSAYSGADFPFFKNIFTPYTIQWPTLTGV